MGKGGRLEERKSLKLDRSRLKSISPDIGEIWLNQKQIRQQEAAQSKKADAVWSATLKRTLQAKKNRLVSSISKRSKFLLIGGVAFIIIVGTLFLAKHKRTQQDVLGGSTVQGGSAQNDGRTDEKPPFTPLFPNHKSADTLAAVTRKTPSGEIIYTFRDYIDDVEIEVTQQAVPESFRTNPTVELEKLATNFQATNVIQLDANKIFHGMDEDTHIQTIIFQKDEVLFFIRSAQKLSDDMWVGFVLSLDK